MSRVGKQPIKLPSGVDVKVSGRMVSVKGPKGELSFEHPHLVSVATKDGAIVVSRDNETKDSRSRHGLVRSILNGMVTGVSEGFKRELEIQGVGYRAQVQGEKIMLTLGFSHPIEFPLPKGIKAEVDKKQVFLTLTGIDKQLIGQVAADLRALRPPDAYKGKGVRRAGEFIKLKAGKAAK
jgi:large subunit ribosomal protein L6